MALTRNAFRVAVAVLSSIALTGCPGPRLRVAVRGAAVAGQPVFVVEDERGQPYPGVTIILVVPCGPNTLPKPLLWKIFNDADARARGAAHPSSFAYGHALPGWTVVESAKPLTAGCYEVGVLGLSGERGKASFTVGNRARSQ